MFSLHWKLPLSIHFLLHFPIGWENNLEKRVITWLASKHSLRIAWSIYPQTEEFKVRQLAYFKFQSLSLIFYTQNCVLDTKFPFLSWVKSGVLEAIFQKPDMTQAMKKKHAREGSVLNLSNSVQPSETCTRAECTIQMHT